MQTCAECRFFNPTKGKTVTIVATKAVVQAGDCHRYPPRHVLNLLTASEKQQDAKDTIETPRTAQEYASPFWWLVVPEYASAYDATNEAMWCGEFQKAEEFWPKQEEEQNG